MNIILLVAIAAIILTVLYILFTYNTLATLKVRIKASIQEIGNQLKRQVELIPNLETSAKAYLKHEKEIFSQLTEARYAAVEAQKSGSLDKAEKASQLISSLLPSIRILVEDNPQMKGVNVISQLMDELRDTADKIMYARRTLIDLTADYNTMRATLPSSLVANMFGFRQEQGLNVAESGAHVEVKDEELKTPKVGLLG